MEFMKVIKSRKSIRSYTDKQITNEELQQILVAGCAAPISQKDYASIHITVVQDKKMLLRISDTVGTAADPLYGVPTLVMISSTKAEVEHIEYFNVACIVENMLLAATNLKVASIFLTYFLLSFVKKENLMEELGIPKGYTPLAAVGLGYPLDVDNWIENEDIENRIHIDRH